MRQRIVTLQCACACAPSLLRVIVGDCVLSAKCAKSDAELTSSSDVMSRKKRLEKKKLKVNARRKRAKGRWGERGERKSRGVGGIFFGGAPHRKKVMAVMTSLYTGNLPMPRAPEMKGGFGKERPPHTHSHTHLHPAPLNSPHDPAHAQTHRANIFGHRKSARLTVARTTAECKSPR